MPKNTACQNGRKRGKPETLWNDAAEKYLKIMRTRNWHTAVETERKEDKTALEDKFHNGE